MASIASTIATRFATHWRVQFVWLRTILLLILSVMLAWVMTQQPTSLLWVSIGIILTTLTYFFIQHQLRHPAKWLARFWIMALIAVLFVFKLSQLLQPGTAIAFVGLSYLVLRLIHLTVEASKQRVANATLSETLIYALHPASLVAGPIDSIQHSVKEQRAQHIRAQYYAEGGWRIFTGLFKKIVLANVCFVFMDGHLKHLWFEYPTVSLWIWLVSYTFYLYFDFSGYSDLAIGVGLLMGLRLPENFNNPYLQPNLTLFWQNWHISFSVWLREYLFMPLSRSLLRLTRNRFSAAIACIAYLATMIFCGLWHGLGTGFIAWGVWHGLGLFISSQFTRWRVRSDASPLPTPISIGLTFMFVMVGWVFFSTDFASALEILRRLTGIA